MNKKQIQIAVCKALVDGTKTCAGCFISDDEFAVTTDGFTCYILFKNEIVFDTSKLKKLDNLSDYCTDSKDDAEIKKSGYLFLCRDKLVEKYKASNGLNVYVDPAIANNYKGFKFYAHSTTGRILVKDTFGRKIGMFLPLKFDEREYAEYD